MNPLRRVLLCAWLLLSFVASAFAGSPCRYRVLLQVGAVLPNDISAFDKVIGGDSSFCRVTRPEDTDFVLVLTRTNFDTAGTIVIPHTSITNALVTGLDSNAATFTAQAQVRTTAYELQTVPTQCEQVHIFVYRKDEATPAFHSSYIETPISRSLLQGFALGLMASGGSPLPERTPCDFGKSKPAKDATKDAMRAILAGGAHLTPAQPSDATTQPSGAQATSRSQSVAVPRAMVGEVYLGSWHSSVFNASGDAALHLSIEGAIVRAKALLTGSQLSEITLSGSAVREGDRWKIRLENAQSGLSATAILMNGGLSGTYEFTAAGDKGNWSARAQER